MVQDHSSLSNLDDFSTLKAHNGTEAIYMLDLVRA